MRNAFNTINIMNTNNTFTNVTAPFNPDIMQDDYCAFNVNEQGQRHNDIEPRRHYRTS